jgi:hypothetical protein
MVEADARAFINALASQGMASSMAELHAEIALLIQGHGFSYSCSWLQFGLFDGRPCVWLSGTDRGDLFIPKVDLDSDVIAISGEEFERIGFEDKIEVYRHKKTGELRYVGRPFHPARKKPWWQFWSGYGAQLVVNLTKQQANRSIVHLFLTLVGMIGIAGLFLPFAQGVSPVAAVSDGALWRLAFPFFLAILASAASIRWAISGSFSGLERAVAYIVSAAMVGVTLTLSMSFSFQSQPEEIHEWVAMLGPYPIVALGLYFLIRNSRIGSSREFNPVLAIQVAYLANAVFCLMGFLGDWQPGAYCALVAALAFALQIVLVSHATVR